MQDYKELILDLISSIDDDNLLRRIYLVLVVVVKE